MRQWLLLGIVSLVLVTPVSASAPFIPVLIPIHVVPTAGAHGSLWISELVVHNSQTLPSSLVVCDTQCVEMLVPPGSHATLLDSYQAAAGGCPGLVLGTYSHTLTFGLRVRDVSRSASSFGAEVPTASINNSFNVSRFLLLNVPVAKEYRYKLRLYDMTGGASSVLVRVLTEPGAEVVAEYDVALAPCGQRQGLSYAEIDPLPESLLAGREGQHLRFELGAKVAHGTLNWSWAFLTITNNETQEVTVVTPQSAE